MGTTPQQIEFLEDIKAAWRVRASADRFLDKIRDGWRFEGARANEPMHDVTEELRAETEATVRDMDRVIARLSAHA